MRRVVYASIANTDMPLPDLLALLQQARQRNAEEGITGLLLYRDRFFLQLVEGSDTAIAALLGRLRSDRRHSVVTLLSDRLGVGERLFPRWRMGFHHLSAIEPLAPEGLIGNSERIDAVMGEAVRDDPGGRIIDEFLHTHARVLRAGTLPAIAG